jgi:hypothetical protein
MAVHAKARLPLRLELVPQAGATLVAGQRWRAEERLAGSAAFRVEWLVRAPRGGSVLILVRTQGAGAARHVVRLEEAQ